MTDLSSWLKADILSLGMAADEARRNNVSQAVVTYLRVHTASAEDVAAARPVPEGAREVRIYELPAAHEDAVSQIRALKAAAGERRVAAYSMAELEQRCHDGWGDLKTILTALRGAGLSDVAEFPLDELTDPVASLELLTSLGFRSRRLTIARPVGERKLEIIERAVQCAEVRAWPLAFAPLPRRVAIDKPTTGYEDLRMVALARLALDHEREGVASPLIEVDWSLYGPKLAQVALTFGADHLDAVAATSDAALGPRREAVQDVERNIRAAGFEPVEFRPLA